MGPFLPPQAERFGSFREDGMRKMFAFVYRGMGIGRGRECRQDGKPFGLRDGTGLYTRFLRETGRDGKRSLVGKSVAVGNIVGKFCREYIRSLSVRSLFPA